MSKKKYENGKVIVSERINIGELEAFIRSAYMDTVRVRTLAEEGRGIE